LLSLALLILSAAPQADTVVLTVEDAYERAMAQAPELRIADLEARAAVEQARQSGAFQNPDLSVSAENVGAAREVTGLPAPDGIEGQAVLSIPLPLGPTRSGVVTQARGLEAAARAGLAVTTADAALSILGGLGALVREQALVENARLELATLTRLAEALALQAEEGRASRGDAARAELARGMAATALARRRVLLASSSADLAQRLGVAPDDVLTLQPARCGTTGGNGPGTPQLWEPGTSVLSAVSGTPDLARAAAEVEAARGVTDQAHGARLPDLVPQVGLRRGQGASALFLGFSTTLPFFNRGNAGVASARLREDAAATAADALEARLAVDLAAARRGMEALEEAGGVFASSWFQALDEAVTAAEARYELGEGTLFELLDQRRARLQALDDYATWQTEWWNARARVIRLQGAVPDATLICTDPFREN
jgi:cobalt-zinc-cadmium efflux system outer membrane protein